MQALNSINPEPSGELEFNRLLRSAAILVVDDEPGMRNFLKRALENRCALLEVAGSAEEAEALRLRYHFDLLLVDIRLPGLSGLAWLGKLRERGVRTHVIYMTAYADLEMAIAALRNGADDFIMKPFRTEQMFISMQRALMRGQIQRENSLLKLQLEQMKDDDGVIGDSPVIKDVLMLVQRAAPTQSNVLVQGETGTGKALVARAIHSLSRRSGAFVTLNCGTLNEEDFDRELFGYLKGAFIGASETRDGLFVHASKGTLFLDEIGQLSFSAQAKLLRVLELGVIRPMGGSREIPVDVRVIVSTTRDLEQLTESGSFRSDLYYRLNVLPISVPPLRERGRDIELLVQYFMERLSAELRLLPVELMHTDWEQLNSYYWPGNVRELRNVVERTLLLGQLPSDSLRSTAEQQSWSGPGYPLDWTIESVERSHIEAVLDSVNNNKSAAARLLGVSRKTLERKQTLWYGSDEEDP
ncbi:MAG: sigma-54-dependent transcriptional regulator [Granulosicoccus sp.]